MPKLSVIGLVLFERSTATRSTLTHLTNVVQFQSSSHLSGIEERFDPENDVLYLLLGPLPSYDQSTRAMLTLFLLSHHIYWLLPTPNLTIESLRLLRMLQSLRLSMNISNGPPSISFVSPSSSFSTEALNLRFRAQMDTTIKTLVTPISLSPPLFQTPIQKPILVAPIVPYFRPGRDRLLKIKRFQQIPLTIVQSIRLRASSSVPNSLESWRSFASTTLKAISTQVSTIVSPHATVSRLFWDELLPGLADAAMRSYSEKCPKGIYNEDIHMEHAHAALDRLRATLPVHVLQQIERNGG